MYLLHALVLFCVYFQAFFVYWIGNHIITVNLLFDVLILIICINSVALFILVRVICLIWWCWIQGIKYIIPVPARYQSHIHITPSNPSPITTRTKARTHFIIYIYIYIVPGTVTRTHRHTHTHKHTPIHPYIHTPGHTHLWFFLNLDYFYPNHRHKIKHFTNCTWLGHSISYSSTWFE